MYVKIRVTTNCAASSIEVFGEELKVKVKAKPVKGKANKEVAELLANYFNVPVKNVKITSGFNSSKKTIEIQK